MVRVKRGVSVKFRHNKIIKLSKGYRGRRKNVYKIAKQSVYKSLQYSYIDRKKKKRVFRSLWIHSINIFLRNYNISYSIFIFRLKKMGFIFNRKILYNIFIYDNYFFFYLLNIIRLI